MTRQITLFYFLDSDDHDATCALQRFICMSLVQMYIEDKDNFLSRKNLIEETTPNTITNLGDEFTSL